MKSTLKKPQRKTSRCVTRVDRDSGKKTWILLVQRTQAKLMEYPGFGKQLKNIAGYVNPEGRLQTKELVSDRPGRVHRRSVGGGRHPAPASEQAHEHSLTVFARELASVLEKGLATGKCGQILLAAEPHCFGKVKKCMSAAARRRLFPSEHKDLFRLNSRDLFSKLEGSLRQ